MPVRRIAHDEHAPVLHVGRVHVVDGPSVGRNQLDLQFRVAHELARHLRGHFFVHLGGGLVDVVTPDNQPFVPRAHHAHEPHADAANVRAGLHDPVEHAGPMRDVFGQIRAEEDVHGSADAHLAFERQPRMFGDQRIAPIRANQVLRADNDVFSRQSVAAGGSYAVGVLRMIEIFHRHSRLRASSASGAVQNRFHEGLREIDHVARRGELMFGSRERVFSPAFHAADLFPGKAFAEDVFAHQILMHAVHVGFRLDLVPQIAQHLHASLVGDVGARRVRKPPVAVDGHVLDSAA